MDRPLLSSIDDEGGVKDKSRSILPPPPPRFPPPPSKSNGRAMMSPPRTTSGIQVRYHGYRGYARRKRHVSPSSGDLRASYFSRLRLQLDESLTSIMNPRKLSVSNDFFRIDSGTSSFHSYSPYTNILTHTNTHIQLQSIQINSHQVRCFERFPKSIREIMMEWDTRTHT